MYMENSVFFWRQRWQLTPQATHFVILSKAVKPGSASLLMCPGVYGPGAVQMNLVKTSQIQLFSCLVSLPTLIIP